MPSSYSPDLRLELPAAGEQTGLWGQTTNRNLGTLIESAIAGATSVSVTTANQALTALNGADDQSRHAMLVLTTTTGADFAVYAPPASKTYIVRNASSYTATIYNSTVLGNTTAAGAGVAVPAGKTLLVFSDGTDFRTIDAVNLTGTLAVANGGTGTTTSTGSGSVVLSASPALTGTPTAPTAGAGTNTTQLATTAFVQAALQAVYPVGSIYINAVNATNPGTLLGFGTWAAFGAGRMPVGFNAADPLFDTAEETGGSKDAIVVSHTHSGTTAISGSHTHGILSSGESGTVGNFIAGASFTNRTIQTQGAGDHSHTFTTDASGSSGTNANLPPYITVYMWKRTA